MRKTILMPTDFSIESLMLVKQAALISKSDELDIILMYCAHLSDSITDLLFYSPTRILEPLISKDFKEACSVLQNKYSTKIFNIRVEIFHGKNNAAFSNFIAGKKVDEAFIPKKYIFKLRKDGFDPLPYIRKSKLTINEIDWEEKKNLPEKDKLAELFAD